MKERKKVNERMIEWVMRNRKRKREEVNNRNKVRRNEITKENKE